ncbi:MAG: LysR family transcriptional regulator [Rhodocyclaceae bacterium]|nr:LysR family transcriptional regulator [Rhodocyclaceae bacterium]
MDKLSMMVAFVALVEKGSYTLAAEKIGGSKSVVSQRIRRLEENLGVRLVNRNTRSVSITDSGRIFYRRCLDILDQIAAVEQELTTGRQEISGELRIAAPQTFGLHYVVPICSAFALSHAAVHLDLELSDKHVDLVERHFDVGVRIGFLDDSNLTARTVGHTRVLLVAAPEYLAAHGTPAVPEDLSGLDCIFDTNKRKGQCWETDAGDGPSRISITPRMSVNSAEGVRAAALHGVGITRCFAFLVRDDLAAGRLVELLPDMARQDLPVQIVFPHRTLMPAKTRAFIDHIADALGTALAADGAAHRAAA